MDERATCSMKCPQCGEEYFDYIELKDDPDRLCSRCFEAWNGMTADELLESAFSAGDGNGTG